MTSEKFLIFKILDEETLVISRCPKSARRSPHGDRNELIARKTNSRGIEVRSVSCPEITSDCIYVNGGNFSRDSKIIPHPGISEMSGILHKLTSMNSPALKGRIFL